MRRVLTVAALAALTAGCGYQIGGPAPTDNPRRPGFSANHGSRGFGTGRVPRELPESSRKELERVRTGP
jgi:hypothetical protein